MKGKNAKMDRRRKKGLICMLKKMTTKGITNWTTRTRKSFRLSRATRSEGSAKTYERLLKSGRRRTSARP